MFPRHTGHLDCWALLPFSYDIDEHVLEEVQVMDRGECFAIYFRLGEVGLCVRCRNDG